MMVVSNIGNNKLKTELIERILEKRKQEQKEFLIMMNDINTFSTIEKIELPKYKPFSKIIKDD